MICRHHLLHHHQCHRQCRHPLHHHQCRHRCYHIRWNRHASPHATLLHQVRFRRSRRFPRLACHAQFRLQRELDSSMTAIPLSIARGRLPLLNHGTNALMQTRGRCAVCTPRSSTEWRHSLWAMPRVSATRTAPPLMHAPLRRLRHHRSKLWSTRRSSTVEGFLAYASTHPMSRGTWKTTGEHHSTSCRMHLESCCGSHSTRR